ncbi:MAG: hypothetical protein HY927_09815 [Elusimicrobia bacterium]|nr:hypothetical protein [Elusimicrobiota bacterium]
MKIRPIIHSVPLAAATIIVSGLAFVNSSAHGAPIEKATPQVKNPSKDKKAALLQSLIKRLMEEGFEDDVLRNLRDDLEIPLDAPLFGDGADAELMTDQTYNRTCVVVMEKSPEGKTAAKHLVFMNMKRSDHGSEGYGFRTSPEGVLEKAFVQRGKYDDQGKPVRGSAAVTPLDIGLPDVKARLQRELDFWLHGKGRKKPGAGKTKSPGADALPSPGAAGRSESPEAPGKPGP